MTPTPNAAPIFTSTSSTSAKEGHAYAYTVSSTDADGDTLTTTAISMPSGATFSSGVIAWTPSAAQIGTPQTFTLRAADSFGGQQDQSWAVTPTADAAPTFLTTAATNGIVGLAYSYLAGASDAEGDPVTYTLITKPAWATLAGNTVVGTPSAPGPSGFTLRASDGIKTTDQSWTVSVAPAGNHAPVITSAPLTSATGGQPYTYFLAATDADGDAISFQLQAGPTGAALNGNALTWTPSSSQERTASNLSVVAVDVWGATSTPQTWSITPTGTIQGSSVLTYLPFNRATGGITPTPVPNPGSLSIGAVVPNGGGAYTSLYGAYHPTDGTYSISGVPGGKFWLTYNNFDFIWTDQAQVDLGWTISGRKDQEPATTSPTNVVFNLTGMNPWDSYDYLQLFDFNSNLYENPNYDAQSGMPSVGDTALAGLTVDWALNPVISRNLIDSTKGDAPLLVQMVTQTSGTTSFQLAKKQFAPSSLTVINGVGATLSGAFTDIPLTSTFNFNLKGSAFAQHAGAVTPVGTPIDAYMALISTPGRSAYGTANSLDLLWYYQSGAPTDLNLGAISVPTAASGFEPSCIGYSRVRRSHQLVGTTIKKYVYGYVWLETTTLPTANAPVQPLVSPVLWPTIGGQSIANDVAGVGVTPTLSWTRPTLGSPTGYVVSLSHLWVNGTSTVSSSIARFYTSATSVTVPPGLMVAGQPYIVTIRAYASPGWDPSVSPYRASKPATYGFADFLSGIILP